MYQGQHVAGRYRLDRQLGSGGMGVVWQATDLELRRVVALKRSHSGDGAQIRREARIGASLRHPHVITVHDVVLDGEDRWLVMEYLDARSVEEILRSDGPLPDQRVAALGAQVASALAAMHAQDMTHRDVTPANVLLTEDGTAKLTDLGISSWAQLTLTGSAQVGGTAGYVAPEVAQGRPSGPAADVFALGATLFTAIEGMSPWGSGTNGPFEQIHRAMNYRPEPMRRSTELTDVIDAMLQKQPDRRPSAEEAQAMLTGTPSAPTGVLRRVPGRLRRAPAATRRAVLVAVAVAVVLSVAAGVLVHREPSPGAGQSADKAAPGAMGAQRQADPCALVSREALQSFGKPLVEPNLGNFGECDVATRLPNTHTVLTTVTFHAPEQSPEAPIVPGRVGPIDPVALVEPNYCERKFSLPNRVVIKVGALDVETSEPTVASTLLCSMAYAETAAVHIAVDRGPIPAREVPVPTGSLAQQHACALLDRATLDRVLGPRHTELPGFGDWSCRWGDGKPGDGNAIASSFRREYPILHDPGYGKPFTTHGMFGRYQYGARQSGSCEVTLRFRTYTPVIPSIDDSAPQRDEVLRVDYTDRSTNTNPDAVCGTARTIAAAMALNLDS